MIEPFYVLFTRIPIYITSSNRRFCDRLWAKDLRLHLDYIANFEICCPVIYSEDTDLLEDITEYDIKSIYELKHCHGYLSVLKSLVPNFLGVVKACKKAEIVHSGGAGWPFTLSFYILLLKPFLSFQWVLVIESSSWMLAEYKKYNLRAIFVHYLNKFLLSLCVTIADARIFTQSYYRKFFLGEETDRTLIAPATWVDENRMSSPEEAKQRYLERKGQSLKAIFPTRLIEDKGVFTLLQAIERLKTMNVPVTIAIMGSGDLEEVCRKFCSKDYRSVDVVYLEQVNYNEDFFSILHNYDVVLVPNLKQEQPRIIFDAFSQGVGVIASDTRGILEITNPDNALHFKTGDSEALAKAIARVVETPDLACNMGQHGLNSVKGKTHWQMHLDRKHFFERVLRV